MEIIVFPSEGAEEFSVYVKTPIGTNLDKTSKKLKEIEKMLDLISKDEIGSYTSIIGTHGDIIEQSNLAYIRINLTPFSTRSRTASQIVEELNLKTISLKGFSEIVYDVKDSGPSSSKPIYRIKFMAVAVLVFKTVIAHKPQQCFSAVTYPSACCGVVELMFIYNLICYFITTNLPTKL